MFSKAICFALLSASLSAFTAQAAPAVDDAALVARFGGFGNRGRGGAKGSAGTKSKSTSSAAVNAANTASSSTTASAAASSASGASNSTNNANSKNGGGNPQTSDTLDNGVLCTACENNGQGANATAGQTPSLTSNNNFINFCLGSNLPNTNGLQVAGGSCNSIIMGEIPAKNQVPHCKITSPENFSTLGKNQSFTINVAVANFATGDFVNPDTNYYAAPMTLVNGVITGHSHVVIQQMKSLTDPTPLDPTVFAFFKGLNDAAQNGVLSTTVATGLDAGVYRLSTINTAANHQAVNGPVAQRGSVDDAIYFTVSDSANGGSGNNNASNSTASASGSAASDTATATNGAAVSSSAAAATSTAKAAGGKGGKNGGRGGRGGRSNRHRQFEHHFQQ